ncbi:MAG: tetratricopeptide repeat protein [Pseudomonadota bacterium]
MAGNYDPYLKKCLKEYQENPRSRVFAPLAEAYRKSGLIDEALEICKEGLEHHPTFTSGIVALARCYIDKGRYTAAIKELEKVVSEVPDNYLAQKLLAQCYSLAGDKNNSLKAYKMVLFLNPRDEEVLKIIKDMEGVTDAAEFERKEEDVYLPPLPDEKIRVPERVELLDEPRFDFEEKNIRDAFNYDENDSPEKILTDISTMTMGMLLEEQGVKDKALEIYRKVYNRNPSQKNLKERIERLEKEVGLTSLSENEMAASDKMEDSDAFSDQFHDDIKQKLENHIVSEAELIYRPEKDLLDEIYDNEWKPKVHSEKLKKLEALLERITKYRRMP